MSHQTGIKANEELRSFLKQCKNGKTRVIKIEIEKEELQLVVKEPVESELEQDYGKHLPKLLEPNKPCYVLFRLDTQSPQLDYDWLLISYSPETAPVRAKMLLAATRATLKMEFGASYIKDELHAPHREDASLTGYRRHLSNKSTPGPMTELEQELQGIKMEEASVRELAMQSRTLPSQTLRGVAFPIDGEAQDKLRALKTGAINYLQLSVDTLNEAIKLEKDGVIPVEELITAIPRNKPRYHFYCFKHTYDGRPFTSMVFMYSIPGSGASIKERMLYSSCKGPFLQTVEKFIGLQIDRKIELDSSDKVTEEYLFDEVHPKLSTIGAGQPNSFSKPRGPPGRGLPRITRIIQ